MNDVTYGSRTTAYDSARKRVEAADNPALQVALEQLAVTHKIRALLLWTLVVVPVLLVAVAVVLTAARPGL